MAYGNILATLGAKPGIGGPPPAPAMGVGMGAPPTFPGAPPAPTGAGAIPTGDPSTVPKAAADQAILSLREAQGHFPNLSPMIDAMIDALKAVARPPAPPPPPTSPNAPPESAPVLESGSPGPV